MHKEKVRLIGQIPAPVAQTQRVKMSQDQQKCVYRSNWTKVRFCSETKKKKTLERNLYQ